VQQKSVLDSSACLPDAENGAIISPIPENRKAKQPSGNARTFLCYEDKAKYGGFSLPKSYMY